MKFRRWLMARLKERSTWAGLIAFVSAAGVSLAPDQKEAIITAGVALASVVMTFTKDDPEKD